MGEIPYYLPAKAIGNLKEHKFSDDEATDLLEGSIEEHARILQRALGPGEFFADFYPAGVNVQVIHRYIECLKKNGLDIGNDGAFGYKMPYPGKNPTRFLIIFRRY